MTEDRIEELRSEVSDLEDKIEELEDLLSDALIDKEHFEQHASYLEDALDECESPTVGMSTSQVSCYETFMEILHALPKPAHEIEEELIKMFLNDK